MADIMDDIVENMGKDFDYQTKIKVRKKMKEAPVQDAVDAFDEAEIDALNKVKKKYTGKMGGGMMKKPMGYTDGGMCRGMGAAIRGGKFEGVK